MNDPIEFLNKWLKEEGENGAPNPQQAVLSTATEEAIPHARVVAIREVTSQGLLFFTQKETRKVAELLQNPYASITFWFELMQREVIVEGKTELLSDEENGTYWETYPREAQIRFYSYAPTSAQPIKHKQILEERKKQIEKIYQNIELPVNPFYCGFRFKPNRMIFYAYRTDELSDVFEYRYVDDIWTCQLLSP